MDIPRLMMTNLPEPVSEVDILEMFSFADKNNDGKISWEEFLVFILY
jgi:Ca2+-binding EF-hand superfamily protein